MTREQAKEIVKERWPRDPSTRIGGYFERGVGGSFRVGYRVRLATGEYFGAILGVGATPEAAIAAAEGKGRADAERDAAAWVAWQDGCGPRPSFVGGPG